MRFCRRTLLEMKEGVSIPVTYQVEALVSGQIDSLLKSWYGCAPVDVRRLYGLPLR